MRLIYVAGPYRSTAPGGVQVNIARARVVALDCWRRGWAAICPHLNSSTMDGLMPDESFLAGGIEMLRRCDALALVPDWHDSVGTRAEVAVARELGLPIYGWPDIPEADP